MKKAFTLIELLIVVAIIAILAAIAVPNFLEAQTRAKVARVSSDMRSFATALETYMIDNSTYFPHWPFSTIGGATLPTGYPTTSINFELNKNPTSSPNYYAAGTDAQPSFGLANRSGNNAPLSLTTPVSYMNAYVPDTFGSVKQATFNYAASGQQYMLWSPGPDTPVSQLAKGNAAEALVRGGSSLPSNYLTAGPNNDNSKPSGGPTSGDSFTYDSSNGTNSVGDVYRNK